MGLRVRARLHTRRLESRLDLRARGVNTCLRFDLEKIEKTKKMLA